MKTISLVACAALSLSCTAVADTTLSLDGTGGEQPQQILIMDGRVLMRSSDGEEMIYDRQQNRMTIIDHAQRGYFFMSPQSIKERTQTMQAESQKQMQAMQAEIGPMMEQMRQQMQAMMDDPNIPPAQKQMIQQQMQAMAGTGGMGMSQPGSGVYERQPMTIKATGENRRIAGIDCAMHMVSEGGQPVEEVCVATPQAVGIPQDDYQTLRGMFAFMQEMADQVMGGAGGFAMPDFDGVPVQIRDLDDGSVSTLRSVSTRKINANALSVPADYRQLDPYQ